MDLRPWVKKSFLGTSLLLLAGEAFVLALPSFPRTFYTGALVGVGEGALHLLTNMTWIAFAFAACSVVASWCFAPAGWMLRLARSIAVGIGVFHWFFAPGSSAYGRMLWGAC